MALADIFPLFFLLEDRYDPCAQVCRGEIVGTPIAATRAKTLHSRPNEVNAADKKLADTLSKLLGKPIG